jgi:hypothetical protein
MRPDFLVCIIRGPAGIDWADLCGFCADEWGVLSSNIEAPGAFSSPSRVVPADNAAGDLVLCPADGLA